jgi:GWxTD domain-containing protein
VTIAFIARTMESMHSSTALRSFSRLLLVMAAAVVFAAGAPARAASKVHTAEELFQPFLEGELSHWLVGPIGRMASEDEITAYLRLKTTEEANQFIDAFWAKRDPDPSQPGNAVLDLFTKRAAEADKKFAEAAVAGRRTDRGTIHVLYGEPESVEYEEFRDVSGPDIELWRYPKKAETGLDGRRPEKDYRFAKLDDLTRFYGSRERADEERRRRYTEPGFPSGRPGVPGDSSPGEPGLPSDPP